MQRLLLIANAGAGSMSGYTQEVIARALSAEFDVRQVVTKRAGHATHVARGAAHEGYDLVVALGGDGTVNEVANGVAGTEVPIAVLPAGGANVFARSLGIPTDPVEATGLLLEHAGWPPRRVSLGRVDDRYFTFCCGVGLDAAIVRRVERRQLMKRAAGDLFYVWTGLRLFFFGGRRRPPLRVSWGDGPEESRDRLHLVVVQNSDPYTFWGRRPLRVCPQADLDDGLDLFAVDTMRTSTMLRVVIGAFGSGRHVRNRHVLYLHDRNRFEVECDVPMPVQADGEYMGERTRVVVESVPDALSVVC